MQDGTSAAATPQAAYTDLYDEERSRFLVQYPPLLIILLGLGGVLAILITGFQGYNVPVSGSNPVTYTYPNFAEELFHEPWLLFFWFCALMVTIQWSIFRHPLLTRQRVQTLIATGISIVLVILGYFFRGQLQNIGIQIGNFINAIFQVNIS
ncbi:MAG: hypothetical protein H0X24_21465, partial [Ktedonobacterales bacterium]|nr:hypothetical protein [Ktedonobacterales bacterium]